MAVTTTDKKVIVTTTAPARTVIVGRPDSTHVTAPTGTQGPPGPDEVWVGPDAPDDPALDLWYDPDAEATYSMGPPGAPGPPGLPGGQGEQGIQGLQGAVGPPGISTILVGSVPTIADLPPASSVGVGDAYVVDADGDIYTSTGTDWLDVGQIVGPQGQQGVQGERGLPSPQWVGAWSPLLTYPPNVLVTREGSTWISTKESTGLDPVADPSRNTIASLIPASPLALGSPQSIASNFTVDRDTNVVAMNMAQAFAGLPGGEIGIAAAINVPAVGTIWLGKGVPDALGYVTLDTTAVLSAGVTYWVVIMNMPAANAMIDQGGDFVGSHMAWGGEFWYGTTSLSNNLGIYAIPTVLYGSTGEDAWQLFVAQGEPGADGEDGDTWWIATANGIAYDKHVQIGTVTLQPSQSGMAAGDALRAVASNNGASISVQNLRGDGYAGIEYVDHTGQVKVFTGHNNADPGEFRFHNISGGAARIRFMTNGAERAKITDAGLLVRDQPINPWVAMTQAAYDALGTKDPNTLYVVT